MRSPLLRAFFLASAGLACALFASCEEGVGPTTPAPTGSVSASQTNIARPQTEIPAFFRAEWNLRLEDCGRLESDGRLVITARELEFYESRGKVISAAVVGDSLTVSAAMSGEGETWEESYHFRLASDGQALLQPVSQGDDGVRRLRCPGDLPH